MAITIRTNLSEPENQDFTPHRPLRPAKAEGGKPFRIVSDYQPAATSPPPSPSSVEGMQADEKTQVLLGVTGSGKTYTMAQVIETLQRPALVLAPNKILAAQLYGEFKSFFPTTRSNSSSAITIITSPRPTCPGRHLHREGKLGERGDRPDAPLGHPSLLERDDVIIVASVSCIYGIGSVETYSAMVFSLKKGMSVDQREIIRKLVALQYKRNDQGFARGNFRVRGDSLEIFPSHYEDTAWRVPSFGDEIEEIVEFDPLTGKKAASLDPCEGLRQFHYVTPGPTMKQAMEAIRHELTERLKELEAEGKLLEHQRLEQRTNFDLEMIAATGSCAGIENYSRFLTGRLPGEPPPTLFEYLPTTPCCSSTKPPDGAADRRDGARRPSPQDHAGEYGFRLPSCIDNRPLRFNEWDAMRPQTVAGLRHAGLVGDGADRRRLRRTGHPPHRPDRPAGGDQAGRGAGPGPHPGSQGDRGQGLPHARHDADQAHGRGPHRISPRGGLRVRYMHSDVETLERSS
jgi:excinuclease ABC subunit B